MVGFVIEDVEDFDKLVNDDFSNVREIVFFDVEELENLESEVEVEENWE